MISKETEAEIVRLYHGERWPIGTIAGQLGLAMLQMAFGTGPIAPVAPHGRFLVAHAPVAKPTT